MNTTNILSIAEAVQALRQGQVIIYPTETFYAIGGDAFHAEAVKSVFTIKQRSAYFPLPLIVPHKEAVNTLAAFIPETAVRLMEPKKRLCVPLKRDLTGLRSIQRTAFYSINSIRL